MSDIFATQVISTTDSNQNANPLIIMVTITAGLAPQPKAAVLS